MYKILENEYSHMLAKDVNEHIVKGWKPLGGVSVYHNGGMHSYYQQAMVKGF